MRETRITPDVVQQSESGTIRNTAAPSLDTTGVPSHPKVLFSFSEKVSGSLSGLPKLGENHAPLPPALLETPDISASLPTGSAVQTDISPATRVVFPPLISSLDTKHPAPNAENQNRVPPSDSGEKPSGEGMPARDEQQTNPSRSEPTHAIEAP